MLHGESLPQTISTQSLVSNAQAVYLLQPRQTEKVTDVTITQPTQLTLAWLICIINVLASIT